MCSSWPEPTRPSAGPPAAGVAEPRAWDSPHSGLCLVSGLLLGRRKPEPLQLVQEQLTRTLHGAPALRQEQGSSWFKMNLVSAA